MSVTFPHRNKPAEVGPPKLALVPTTPSSNDPSFPAGFLWGAATSAHQTEGYNTNTDWWRAEQRRTVPFKSGAACDSWHQYPQDHQLLQDLGLNAHRLSVEWARIEPEPGRFDQSALDHYRRVLESLRAHGIEPVVTLHHFTNPLWFADAGGWTRPEAVGLFARYASVVGRALGDLVHWWITINEPSVFGLVGYITGDWPPHRKNDLRGYVRHMRYVIRGHRAGRHALRALHPSAQVSMAFHLNPLEPFREWDVTDQVAAKIYDWLWQGKLLATAVHNLDWIGLNYYFRLLVRWDLFPWRLLDQPVMGSGEKSDFGWELYPEGLYRLVKRLSLLRKPIMVTENGLADADDDQRGRFIVEHLRQLHSAQQEGAKVLGYMHWSLLDNFEWAEGFTKRFGLAHVDFATQRRQLRPSAGLYGDIARANALDPAIVARVMQAPAALAA